MSNLVDQFPNSPHNMHMKRAHLPPQEVVTREIGPIGDFVVRALDLGVQRAHDSVQALGEQPCRQTVAGLVRTIVIAEMDREWASPGSPKRRRLDNDGIEFRTGRYNVKVRLFADGQMPAFPISQKSGEFFRQTAMIEFLAEAAAEGWDSKSDSSTQELAPVNLAIGWDVDPKGVLHCWLICPDTSGDSGSVAWSTPLALRFESVGLHPESTMPAQDDVEDLDYLVLDERPVMDTEWDESESEEDDDQEDDAGQRRGA